MPVTTSPVEGMEDSVSSVPTMTGAGFLISCTASVDIHGVDLIAFVLMNNHFPSLPENFTR
jgi:hypothetical protein